MSDEAAERLMMLPCALLGVGVAPSQGMGKDGPEQGVVGKHALDQWVSEKHVESAYD